jgi:hypothetical protein
MKNRVLYECDKKLLQLVNGAPRILGYRNRYDFLRIEKYKDKFKLLFSVYPLDEKGKKICWTRLDMDKSNKHYRYSFEREQFIIVLSINQMKEFIKIVERGIAKNSRCLE